MENLHSQLCRIAAERCRATGEDFDLILQELEDQEDLRYDVQKGSAQEESTGTSGKIRRGQKKG